MNIHFTVLKVMKHLFYFLIIIITASCGSIKTATPTIIGIMPLTSYTVQDQSPSADTTYRVIRSEDVFNSSFSASAADVRKPDFGGQTVVAILFKNAASQPGMQFQKAEIVGKQWMFMQLIALQVQSIASAVLL